MQDVCDEETIVDRCTEAAPILAWAVGKTRDELRAYFARKGWRAVVIQKKAADPKAGG